MWQTLLPACTILRHLESIDLRFTTVGDECLQGLDAFLSHTHMRSSLTSINLSSCCNLTGSFDELGAAGVLTSNENVLHYNFDSTPLTPGCIIHMLRFLEENPNLLSISLSFMPTMASMPSYASSIIVQESTDNSIESDISQLDGSRGDRFEESHSVFEDDYIRIDLSAEFDGSNADPTSRHPPSAHVIHLIDDDHGVSEIAPMDSTESFVRLNGDTVQSSSIDLAYRRQQDEVFQSMFEFGADLVHQQEAIDIGPTDNGNHANQRSKVDINVSDGENRSVVEVTLVSNCCSHELIFSAESAFLSMFPLLFQLRGWPSRSSSSSTSSSLLFLTLFSILSSATCRIRSFDVRNCEFTQEELNQLRTIAQPNQIQLD